MNEMFSGTDTYISTDALSTAVNAAITLERPLLIKGEPGTGKTMSLNTLVKTDDPKPNVAKKEYINE